MLLINTLDLQATHITPDITPLRPSPLPAGEIGDNSLVADSPLKKTLRSSMTSISSLRPYSQSRSTVKPNVSKPPMSTFIGQQIASWPTSIPGLSPLKESSSSSVSNTTPPSSTFHRTHKRTLTPAPEPEPEPLYQLLHPAKVRVPSGTLKASYLSMAEKGSALGDNNLQAASLTFGSRSSSCAGSKGSMVDYSGGSLTPVFKRIHDQERKRSSLVPADFRGSQGSQTSELADKFSLPIAHEMKKVLGMSGTMGGSDVSCYRDQILMRRTLTLMFLTSYGLFSHLILTENPWLSRSLSETIRTTLSLSPCPLVLRLIHCPFPVQVLLQHCLPCFSCP